MIDRKVNRKCNGNNCNRLCSSSTCATAEADNGLTSGLHEANHRPPNVTVRPMNGISSQMVVAGATRSA